MTKIFRAKDRKFEENLGRTEGFRLMSDATVAAGMAAGGGSAGAESAGGSGDKNGGSDAKVFGSGSLNFDVRRLDGGEISSLYHSHRHAEELFMIVGGSATLRTPDGLHVLEAGDIAFFGTGPEGAHQLFNHTDEPCIYLDIRTFLGCDVVEYPDSNRLLVVPTMERFDRATSTGYFEGEPPAAETRKKFVKQ